MGQRTTIEMLGAIGSATMPTTVPMSTKVGQKRHISCCHRQVYAIFNSRLSPQLCDSSYKLQSKRFSRMRFTFRHILPPIRQLLTSAMSFRFKQMNARIDFMPKDLLKILISAIELLHLYVQAIFLLYMQ